MNLSGYPNLEYFEAKSAEALKAQIAQIKLPCEIVSIYFDGKNHVAWINLSRPIKKVKQKE